MSQHYHQKDYSGDNENTENNGECGYGKLKAAIASVHILRVDHVNRSGLVDSEIK